jgi:hypothetical protein
MDDGLCGGEAMEKKRPGWIRHVNFKGMMGLMAAVDLLYP